MLKTFLAPKKQRKQKIMRFRTAYFSPPTLFYSNRLRVKKKFVSAQRKDSLPVPKRTI